jgi:hypothetical protein
VTRRPSRIDFFPGKSVDGTVIGVSPIATTAANCAPMYYATVLVNNAMYPTV